MLRIFAVARRKHVCLNLKENPARGGEVHVASGAKLDRLVAKRTIQRLVVQFEVRSTTWLRAGEFSAYKCS